MKYATRRIDVTQHVQHVTGLLVLIALLVYLLPGPVQAQEDATFTVTVANKTSEHPFFEQGFPEGYVVDGVQGKTLTLVRGRTYTFQMQDVPAIHPFYITTSSEGTGAAAYEEGVTGNFATGDETLTFTPTESTPDVLYYQCQSHSFMGARINVVSEQSAALETVAEGFVHPVVLVEAPDASGRLFVADQTGQIWIVMPDGSLLDEPFLNIEDRLVELNEGYDERGLLGLAFHPDYTDNGRFFVYYSAPLRTEAPDDFNHTSHLAEFQVSSSDPNVADPESEVILLQVDQPQSNHNAGTLAFGPDDGYLYVSLGDGGGADDTGTGHVSDWYDDNDGGNGQDIDDNLLGSILRLDVDNPAAGMNYGIPEDNPFVGEDGLDEQWAYGFRNPYRFSFDMEGEQGLLVGDAGQELWEEVSVVEGGGNYGWNVKEGTHCFDAEDPENPPADCPDTDPEGDPLIDPVIEFANAKQEGGLGQVVVGGYVYRGTSLPEMAGQYVFGAYSRGRTEAGASLPGVILVATPQDEGLWPFQELQLTNRSEGDLGSFLLSFGQDLDGEVYALTAEETGPTGNTGKVFRLVSPSAVDASEEPAELPQALRLEPNYPNPFNPTTTIRYHVARQGHVTLTIYDVMGRQVKRLVEQPVAPGTHTVTWNGTNDAGQPVASGTYLYRITNGTQRDTKVMVLLK